VLTRSWSHSQDDHCSCNKTTMLKRYAPASVRFDAALPAPIDAIHAGDQLRARGTKNADGSEIAAEEVISGTFRNISGAISSVDTTSSTLVVKDLATKKQVTIHITGDAQMRKLPEMAARMLAMRLQGASNGSGAGKGGSAQPRLAARGGSTERASAAERTMGGGGSGIRSKCSAARRRFNWLT